MLRRDAGEQQVLDLKARILRPYTDNLFGALARQLSLAVLNVDTLIMCSGCQKLFSPEKPRVNQRNWCDICSISGVRSRITSRESRAKKRSQGSAQSFSLLDSPNSDRIPP